MLLLSFLEVFLGDVRLPLTLLPPSFPPYFPLLPSSFSPYFPPSSPLLSFPPYFPSSFPLPTSHLPSLPHSLLPSFSTSILSLLPSFHPFLLPFLLPSLLPSSPYFPPFFPSYFPSSFPVYFPPPSVPPSLHPSLHTPSVFILILSWCDLCGILSWTWPSYHKHHSSNQLPFSFYRHKHFVARQLLYCFLSILLAVGSCSSLGILGQLLWPDAALMNKCPVLSFQVVL